MIESYSLRREAVDRVLVSGANGFIGRRLVAILRDEGALVATVGRGPGEGPLHFGLGPPPWTVLQWKNALSAAAPDVVFHLAGAQQGNRAGLEAANVGLACGLFSALQDLKARPGVLLAGSAAEYGRCVIDGVPIHEHLVCAPTGPYGETKLAQTRTALSFADQTGGRVMVARIFNPIGPGMPSHLALGDFARQIAAIKGGHGRLITGNIDVARDFLDVEQAAGILVSLARNPLAEGIINVCSGVPTVVRRLVELMIARSGKAIDIEVDPARLRPGEPRVLFGSTSRLASLLPPPAELGAVVGAILANAERHSSSDHGVRMLATPS
jgi:GDP-4-dehydro-6-deoxy-D-mannose reductase